MLILYLIDLNEILPNESALRFMNHFTFKIIQPIYSYFTLLY